LLERLGAWIARRRWGVLVVAGVLASAGVAAAIGIHDELIAGGFDDPNSDYVRGDAVLQDKFDLGAPNVVLLVQSKDGRVDDPEMKKAGTALTERLRAEPHIAGAESFWTTGFLPLRSGDGTAALIVARVDGNPDTAVSRTEPLMAEYSFETDQYSVEVGGPNALLAAAAVQTQKDYLRGELIAIPITIILLLFVYRSVAAALLPAIVGGFAISATYLVVRVEAGFTDITIFSLNIVTALGLALGIDYSLFIVSRFREELAAGRSTSQAVVRTVVTAGRTVVFSALAVAVSLSALLLFPGSFAKSFAFVGSAVVLMAAIGAVIALPALLAVLGRRVEWGTLPVYRGRTASGEGWYRAAKAMMRRPIIVVVCTVVLLLLVGVPFLHIQLGVPDERSLPQSTESRQVSESVRGLFSGREVEALSLVVTGIDADADTTTLDAYQKQVSEVSGVARVDGRADSCVNGLCGALPEVLVDADIAAQLGVERLVEKLDETYTSPSGDAVWYRVVLALSPSSTESEQAGRAIRAIPAPGRAYLTGQAIQNLDGRNAYVPRILPALLLVTVITFVMLLLMFGSLLVPIKAILMNVLSLSATFGALVWIFQDGHLSGPLGFTAGGNLYVAIPVLLFCVAFGLSMDYEVFMLSRIKEEFDRSGDNEESIAVGLQRSGRIVTTAAITLAVVMFAIGTSELSFIKMVGVGLGMAILIDAFVIRCTLLPAAMKLAGRWNWWGPHWVRRVHSRVGIAKQEPEAPESAPELAP